MSGDRVNVDIDLNDEELFTLMKMAHERDITLNQLVNNIILSEYNKINNDYNTQYAQGVSNSILNPYDDLIFLNNDYCSTFKIEEEKADEKTA